MSTNPTYKLGNPAVVGLAGFGLTTLLLQIHNLGLAGLGPVIYTGLIFGGLAQLIAGLMEFKVGNNFGFSAFTSYGAFWIALVGIFLGNHFKVFESSPTDVGFFLIAWCLYSAIMLVAAMRIHTAMALTFLTLVIGFILLILSKFVDESFHTLAAIDLIICALLAWYMMAGAIYADVFGRQVLPMGKPWIR